MNKRIPVFLILVLALCITSCNTKIRQSTEPEPTTVEAKSKKDETLSLKNVVLVRSHQTAFPLAGVESVRWLSETINQ